jgi:hypothetical protein
MNRRNGSRDAAAGMYRKIMGLGKAGVTVAAPNMADFGKMTQGEKRQTSMIL